MKLDVLYENGLVIVCEKPAGILSQSGAGGKDSVNMLALAEKYLVERGQGETPYLIHRLDAGTGGIMALAKSARSAAVLSEAISDKEKCIKEYLAVVSGALPESEGEMTDYLYKDARAGKSFAVSSPRMGAKKAELSFKVLGVAEGEHGPLSLVRIRLYTGRTPQIRVQFSARGWPIVGDGKYGSRERLRGKVPEGTPSPKDMLALHAFHLALDAGKTAKFDIISTPSAALYPFSLFEAIIVDIAR